MTPLSKKLQLKPDQVLLIDNAPQDILDALVEDLAPTLIDTRPDADGSAILLFVNTMAEAEAMAEFAMKRIGEDGLLWIAYRKGKTSDVHRDTLKDVLNDVQWQAVRLIAIDKVWSAMRFRPME